MTTEGQGPIDYKLRLGEALTRARNNAGLIRTAAADALGCSEDKIGSIERGRSSVASKLELTVLLDLYGMSGDERAKIEELAALARQRRRKTPWGALVPARLKDFFRIEETSTHIEYYHPELLHGLVQTPDYARAIISNNSALRPTEVDRLVEARMARQARLEGPAAIRLTLVMAETVLRVIVGGKDAMRGQFEHLIALIRDGKIDLRLIPFEAGSYPRRGFPFMVLANVDGRKRVYLENLTDGIVIDDELRVEVYEAAFEELLKVALSSDDTLTLLAKVAAEL